LDGRCSLLCVAFCLFEAAISGNVNVGVLAVLPLGCAAGAVVAVDFAAPFALGFSTLRFARLLAFSLDGING
jgi:hypothetical protein